MKNKTENFQKLQAPSSKFQSKNGFTLIELLVVIAIIGILSSIVLVSLGTTRQKARDARRQSDQRQIALAMELCYDKTNCNSLPTNSTTAADYPNTAGGVNNVTFIDNFLATVPPDPTDITPYQYTWLNSTGAITSPGAYAANQWYCMHVPSESIAGSYYVVSSFGVFVKTAIPTLVGSVLTNCN